MGTRIRLGKGFTFGASGLRWGHSIPGVKRSYVSVGRSGTLIAGGRLRHWESARRPSTARGTAPRCQGRLKSGGQCTNTATMVPVDDPRPPRSRPALTCAVHQSQCGALAASVAGTRALVVVPAPSGISATGPSPDAPGLRTTPAQWLRLVYNLAAIALVFLVVPFVVWAAFAQQAGFHRADRAQGLAAAARAGAPGICLAGHSSNVDIPAGTAGHLSWTISTTGACRTGVDEHFVPVPHSPVVAATPVVPTTSPSPTAAGMLNPLVTPASVTATICRPGWAATIRPPSTWTTALKVRQMAAGNLGGTAADYEEDHIVPLELGGAARDAANLRPEPIAEARRKDVAENAWHASVCAGRTSLERAQTVFLTGQWDVVVAP